MRRLLALVVVWWGCGTSSFDYSAQIGWNPSTTPGIEAVSVLGKPVVSGDVIEQTYSDFDAGVASPIQVDVMTTSGSQSFQIVPTRCGHRVCGSAGASSCDDITRERDSWVLELLPTGVLGFDPHGGTCSLANGAESAWNG